MDNYGCFSFGSQSSEPVLFSEYRECGQNCQQAGDLGSASVTFQPLKTISDHDDVTVNITGSDCNTQESIVNAQLLMENDQDEDSQQIDCAQDPNKSFSNKSLSRSLFRVFFVNRMFVKLWL